MASVSYSLNGNNCLVEISTQVFENLPDFSGRRVVVAGDSQVISLYGETVAAKFAEKGAQTTCFAFSKGEKNKNIHTWQRLSDQLARSHCDRHTLLVALGGGVSTDLIGFVAASYMRGLELWLIPTSLLAMVDAAIGGKTAVNTRYGKNLVGAFYLPKRVLMPLDFLKTLPEKEQSCGIAEIIKTTFILDKPLFEKLEAANDFSDISRSEIISQTVMLKAAIVTEDAFDRGKRQLLNYGHTVGHALEKSSKNLSHGEAVAIGMAIAAKLSCNRDLLSTDEYERLIRIIKKFNLPVTTTVSLKRAKKYLLNDKKNFNGTLKFVLPFHIGEALICDGQYTHSVSFDELAEAWPC